MSGWPGPPPCRLVLPGSGRHVRLRRARAGRPVAAEQAARRPSGCRRRRRAWGCRCRRACCRRPGGPAGRRRTGGPCSSGRCLRGALPAAGAAAVLRGASGSSDCSGPTSWSMASKTELTSSPTSRELDRAAGRAARSSASRWDRENEDSVCDRAERAVPLRTPAWSSRWPSDASCRIPVSARRTSPSDSWSRSPERPRSISLRASLQPGRCLVEVELAAVGVVVGQAELEVLHAALQPVEGVTGQGVGTGRGHSAEGSRRDTDGESAGREPLRPAGAGSQLPERGGPVGAPAGAAARAPRGPGTRPRRRALREHGLHGGDRAGLAGPF